MDEEKCTDAGGVVGSYVSPYCRSRQMTLSPVLSSAMNGTHLPYYSYKTCGAIDTYAPLKLLAQDIIGNNLVVAITESKPWTFQGEVDPQKPQWKGWKGVLVDLIDDMVCACATACKCVLSYACMRVEHW